MSHERMVILTTRVIAWKASTIFTIGWFLFDQAVGQEEGIRRVTVGTLGRARIKTVKMTLVIISVFIFCWTPYNIMSIW
jgi:gonadotropin-releasing hormone receptor